MKERIRLLWRYLVRECIPVNSLMLPALEGRHSSVEELRQRSTWFIAGTVHSTSNFIVHPFSNSLFGPDFFVLLNKIVKVSRRTERWEGWSTERHFFDRRVVGIWKRQLGWWFDTIPRWGQRSLYLTNWITSINIQRSSTWRRPSAPQGITHRLSRRDVIEENLVSWIGLDMLPVAVFPKHCRWNIWTVLADLKIRHPMNDITSDKTTPHYPIS